MLSICDLERLPLWDRHSGIAIDAAKPMLFSGLFGLHAHFSLSTQDVPVLRVIFSNLHSDIYK